MNAVQFYFGTDYVSALEGDPYTYGLTSDVTLNARGNVLGVKSSNAKSVTVDASDIVSTATTIDGSNSKGRVYLIGNGQSNVLIASNYGSTLDGGWNKAKNKGTSDKYYGGEGADVYIYDGASNDAIYNYEAKDRIVLSSGAVSSGRLNGQNVTFKVGKNSLTIRDARDKTITLTDADGQTSQYLFTKQNRTLAKALISTSDQLPSDQFPPEEYWFEADAVEASPLDEIVSTEAALDLSTDILIPPAQSQQVNLLTDGSARSRHRSENK